MFQLSSFYCKVTRSTSCQDHPATLNINPTGPTMGTTGIGTKKNDQKTVSTGTMGGWLTGGYLRVRSSFHSPPIALLQALRSP